MRDLGNSFNSFYSFFFPLMDSTGLDQVNLILIRDIEAGPLIQNLEAGCGSRWTQEPSKLFYFLFVYLFLEEKYYSSESFRVD